MLKWEIQMQLKRLIYASAAVLVACGGGEPETQSTPSTAAQPAAPSLPPPPAGAIEMPSWFTLDEAGQTVHMTITAGETPVNNHWNFNGAVNGDMAITVPVGYQVDITFTNDDPVMAHSLGVSAETKSFAAPPAATAVFPGAISENPGSMIDGTMPGETETIAFTASEAGTYTLVCYVPGHATVGMWLYFIVSDSGEAGVRTR